MSYDDGRLADRKLISIFNRYGIKGTFHLNSGSLGQEGFIPADEVKALYTGHEVAVHTLTHPTLERCPKEQVVQQVLEDRKRLEKLTGYPVRGMSYPNGSNSPEIRGMLPYLGIEYSRIVGSSEKFSLPENLYTWESTCHHNHGLMELAEQFAALSKWQCLYIMYVWGHSYEFENEQNWDLMEQFCAVIGNREDIWYATNIEYVDYMKAAKQLQFSAEGNFAYNPSAQPVWIRVDDGIFEIKGGQRGTLW
jgi:Predicted xylanase/chitin deacetylase